MSLLMEALKKAEQSKQQISSPKDVANNTPPKNAVVSTEQEQVEKIEQTVQANDALLSEEKLEPVESDQLPETQNIVEPVESDELSETQNIVEPVESDELSETQNIIEPLEIEDPNSIFDHLDELDWHFEVDDESEQSVVEKTSETAETQATQTSDTSLSLELIEQSIETTQTPLLEKAEIASETQDIYENDNLPNDLEDLETEQTAVIDDIEQQLIKTSEKAQNENITIDDGLEWDAELFNLDEDENDHLPNDLEDLETEQTAVIDNIEQQLIKTSEKAQNENITIDDDLEWDADLFAPDNAEFSNQDTAKYQTEKTEKSTTAFHIESDFIDETEFNLKQTTPQTEQPQAKPELEPDIIHPDALTAKRILQATSNYDNRRHSALFSILWLILFLGIGFGGYYLYQINSMTEFPQFANFKPEQIQPNTEQKPVIAETMPESTQPPITQNLIETNLNEETESTRQTFMQKAKSLLSDVMSEKPVKSAALTTEEVIQYKPAVDEEIEIIKPVKRSTTITQTQKPLITKSIIDSMDEKKPRPLPQQKGSKDIKIKKVSNNTNPLHNQLKQAYQAFQKGQNQHAESLYQQVLNKSNKNRDALLGLAAIAQRRQQTQAAEYYYQQILKYYPNDSMAQMGLNAVQQKSSVTSESQIKILLDKSPQSAYLYFSLGNVYAQQSRWHEAQQAYFDAYRLDEQKADYAYNLAVSLEYLHQSKAALPFYQKALKLGRKQATQFNSEQVKKRIQQLTP